MATYGNPMRIRAEWSARLSRKQRSRAEQVQEELAALLSAAADLQREKDRLAARLAEPDNDSNVPSVPIVITFTKRFGDPFSDGYHYAAIGIVPDEATMHGVDIGRRWYVTGQARRDFPEGATGASWDELLDWIGDDDIPSLWVMTKANRLSTGPDSKED